MKKNPLKSKTVNSALVIILVSVMSLLGFGEGEIVNTFDQLGKGETQTETVKELATLLAAGGAIFGRYKVKEEKDEK